MSILEIKKFFVKEEKLKMFKFHDYFNSGFVITTVPDNVY